MNPVVSVIMPSYQHEAYIGAAIRSVLGQTFDAFELIIVDDASGDTSWSIIEGFDDARIRALRHESNCGAHATLNKALALARGEFVAILNSDDLFHPRRLETLLDAMRSADAGLVFSDLDFIDDDGGAANQHPRALEHRRNRDWCDTQSASTWFLAGNLAVTTSNFLFRRELLDALGGFLPLRYTHDWAWALTVAAHRPLSWVREPLLSYRVHPANTLGEGDRWRHVHENAFILALAMRQLEHIVRVQASQGDGPEALALALLRNRSAPALPGLALLAQQIAGLPEPRSLALAGGESGSWMAARLAQATNLPEEIFLSTGELAGHVDTIRSQAALLDARWDAMQEMSQRIDERDEAIRSQKALIDERWETLQHMNQKVAARERTIADQGRLLEERYQAMQDMGRNIYQRDQALLAALAEQERITAELRETAGELARLRAHPLVRAGRALKRMLRRGG